MRAINSSVMKTHNRRLVLDLIRHRPISRAELAEQTSLTRASITQIVDELMQEGLVAETALVGRNHLGRRMTQLALVKDARYLLGLNIGRFEYDLGIINLSGEVLYHSTGTVAERETGEVLDEVCRLIEEKIEELQLPQERISGIGICAPGPLDVKNGIILNPPNFEKWHNVPIVQEVRRRLNYSTVLENISNAHALDEMYFGIGKQGVENFLLLRVDEGVGAGVILQNRLFTSSNGQGPELGHITIFADGPKCACGNRGCLEQYIAFPAILRDTPFSTWRQLMDQHDSGPARTLLLQLTEMLSDLAVNIINLFDLEKIVLSGHFHYRGEILSAMLNERICGRTLHMDDGCRVVASEKIEIPRIAAMPVYHSMFSM